MARKQIDASLQAAFCFIKSKLSRDSDFVSPAANKIRTIPEAGSFIIFLFLIEIGGVAQQIGESISKRSIVAGVKSPYHSSTGKDQTPQGQPGSRYTIRRMPTVQHYHALVHLLQREPILSQCWQALLSLADQPSAKSLQRMEIEEDAFAVVDQLRRIWSQEPIPATVTFLYFGLYDIAKQGDIMGQMGFYVSGGDGNPIRQLDTGNLSYFPTHRQLHSNVLDGIRATAGEFPEQAAVLDYTVMLGCAAILARHAAENLNVTLPIYAGFDSGDFLLASAGR